jgi:NADH-quinone oxidoreductase subunit N
MTPLDLATPAGLTIALTPDLVLMGGAMLLMLWAAWRPDGASHQRAVGFGSAVLLVATIVVTILFARAGRTATTGAVAVDQFRWSSDLIFLGSALITVLLSIEYNDRESIGTAETHVLLLFATSGMMLLAAARDLIIVFLGVELMSIAVYVLAGLNRRSAKSAEAALKYFLLGAFSTGFLLYGIALIYGATGSVQLPAIGARVLRYGLFTNPMLLVGIALLMVGFLFKVAAAPFHMWAPDVYEGAPTPVTAYMAVAVKAAAFAAFLRVWLEAFNLVAGAWHTALWNVAVLTMLVGNLVALQQKNIKRLLAYSSISHAGYVLVAVVVASAEGSGAFVFYLVAYALATMGAFAVVAAMSRSGERDLMVEDYAGLWFVRPGTAVAMTVFMLALLGFPVFGGVGFFAKWYLLRAALDASNPQILLAVTLVLTSVVSAGYYLAVVKEMFMRARPADAPEPPRTGIMTRSLIGVLAALILVLGLFPDRLVSWAERSAQALPSATVVDVPVQP